MTGAQILQQQAHIQGAGQLLLEQLKLRFGPPSTVVVQHVQQASAEELDLWAERVLTATSIDEVFAG